MLDAIVEEKALAIISDLTRADIEVREKVIRWANSEGKDELPDDLQLKINYPYLTVEVSEQQWSALIKHPISACAWAVSRTDLYRKTLEVLGEEDRQNLLTATPNVYAFLGGCLRF